MLLWILNLGFGGSEAEETTWVTQPDSAGTWVAQTDSSGTWVTQ